MRKLMLVVLFFVLFIGFGFAQINVPPGGRLVSADEVRFEQTSVPTPIMPAAPGVFRRTLNEDYNVTVEYISTRDLKGLTILSFILSLNNGVQVELGTFFFDGGMYSGTSIQIWKGGFPPAWMQRGGIVQFGLNLFNNNKLMQTSLLVGTGNADQPIESTPRIEYAVEYDQGGRNYLGLIGQFVAGQPVEAVLGRYGVITQDHIVDVQPNFIKLDITDCKAFAPAGFEVQLTIQQMGRNDTVPVRLRHRLGGK